MVYMITYDLNKSGQNYEKVIEAVKSASNGNWCSDWKSSWIIQSESISANAVFEKIKPFLDNNDNLIVIELRGNFCGQGTDETLRHINAMFPQSPYYFL